MPVSRATQKVCTAMEDYDMLCIKNSEWTHTVTAVRRMYAYPATILQELHIKMEGVFIIHDRYRAGQDSTYGGCYTDFDVGREGIIALRGGYRDGSIAVVVAEMVFPRHATNVLRREINVWQNSQGFAARR